MYEMVKRNNWIMIEDCTSMKDETSVNVFWNNNNKEKFILINRGNVLVVKSSFKFGYKRFLKFYRSINKEYNINNNFTR